MDNFEYCQALSLQDYATEIINNYYHNMSKKVPFTNVYEMVMSEVELPLLEATMQFTKGNRDKAAKILGISKIALARKIKKYRLEH